MVKQSVGEIIKSLILPFLLGGTIIAGVKFIATDLHNPALAAVVGGAPTGMIAMFFLSQKVTIPYAHNYFFMNLILMTATSLFYILRAHFNVEQNIALISSLVCWAILVASRYLY